LINHLIDFRAEHALEVTRYLFSQCDDGFLDFFIVAVILDLVLHRQDLIQDIFQFLLGFSFFLCRYSDIAIFQETRKLFMEEEKTLSIIFF
jgi:uncharacterized protein YebE (UPF0316 family)